MSALTAILLTEAVARMCCIKKVFVKILQNSQENTCTRAFFNKVAGLRSFHKGPLFLFDINTCFLPENIEDLFSLANKIFDKTKIDSYVASIIESNMVCNKQHKFEKFLIWIFGPLVPHLVALFYSLVIIFPINLDLIYVSRTLG